MNLDNKMMINGVVLCPCGGQVISNSGKVMSDRNGFLKCWHCEKKYKSDIAFSQRKENEIVTIKAK